MQSDVVAAIFVATLLSLYLRPFGARDWHIAVVGGALAWAVGPLTWSEGLETVAGSWNIVAFFGGLMLLAAGAEASGLYARAARLLSVRGERRRVARTLGVGTGVTAILSNDATPLILTPAVFAAAPAIAAARGPAFATTFIADGASLLLPVSNPVNLLFFERFEVSFGWYLSHISVAALLAVAAMAGVLVLRTRPKPSDIAPHPAGEIAADARAWAERFALLVIAVLAVAYLAGGLLGWPLGLVTISAGVILIAGLRVGFRSAPLGVRRHVSLGMLVFVASLLLLVESVAAAGLLDGTARAIERLAGQPALVTVVGAALLATVLSNLMNNWPAALLLAAVLEQTGDPSGQVLAGCLIGCTIGANFTPVGSLSTVFWQTLARQRGAVYGQWEYVREAALPTAVALTVACLVAQGVFVIGS